MASLEGDMSVTLNSHTLCFSILFLECLLSIVIFTGVSTKKKKIGNKLNVSHGKG